MMELPVLDETAVQIIATVVKFLVVLVAVLHIPPVMIWVERRAPALMQRRRGPNRVGFFRWRLWGLLQTLADALKLIFKEESVPGSAYRGFFHLAPLIGLLPTLLFISAIPFGPGIEINGWKISLSVIDLDIGLLFILAVTGIGVYGVTLAGWASNGKFSLLGSLRASAQMISYEIPLGLSLIPLVLLYGSLNLQQLIYAQASVWKWGVFLSPVSFLIFLVCMFAETNRAPFDLSEGESELVAGFHTEYGSAKFALFFLSEYVAMFALSCLCSVLFFGGWQIPFVSNEQLVALTGSVNLAALFGVVTLLLKAAFFMWLYVWVRWTLPRFRYDQLMKIGWKFLLPLALANVCVTALVLAALA
jgi:NADH-quinone oxidoreductase subunit H